MRRAGGGIRSLRGLAPRLTIAMTAVVVAVLAISLVGIQWRAGASADATLTEALDATRTAVDDQLTSRRTTLRRIAEELAKVPQYRSRVESALAKGDHAALFDQATEFRNATGATWALITGADGVLAADTRNSAAAGDSLGGGALVGVALQEGHSTEGVWVEPGAKGDLLFQAVGVPLTGTAGTIGVLVVASAVDSALAQLVKRGTGTDIVFFSRDTLDRAHPVAGTLDPAAVAAPLAEAVHDTATQGVRLQVQGDWVGTVGTLRTAAGYPAAGYVGLRSRNKELARFTALEQTVALVGVLGLLIGIVASVLTARAITRPVQQLATATREVSEGRYDATIPPAGDDEIGELATAFDRMLTDLREKQRVVEFLMGGASGGTAARSISEMATRLTSTLLSPGAVFANRYRIEAVLGSGGMGVVYRATDQELGEPVAIKTLKLDALALDPNGLERFKQEIRLARRITHRNVVRTHDLGEQDGLYYITMEFVEGSSLSGLIQRRGRLPADVTVTIGKQLLRALEVAHEAGIVHRDIKPPNLIVEPSGLVKVMDFGIARAVGPRATDGAQLTAMGTMIGTPDYMAPEQILGEDVDARADLYAAGAVLHECLTGRTLFQAPTVLALATMQLHTPAPDPRTLAPDVPAPLAAVILRALEKDRNHRWPTAAAMLAALEAAEREMPA